MRGWRLVFAMTLATVPASARAEGAAAVDAAVVLAADVSRSINDDEFALERKGYSEAIESQKLMDVISTGPNGAVAFAYVEWAGESEQKVVVDWTIVRKADDAKAFADALVAAPRAFVGRTAIGSAIDFAFARFAAAPIAAPRKIIDVSGDGTSNQGRPVTSARDAAVEAGAVINGLTIFNRRAAEEGGYLALHTNPPGVSRNITATT